MSTCVLEALYTKRCEVRQSQWGPDVTVAGTVTVLETRVTQTGMQTGVMYVCTKSVNFMLVNYPWPYEPLWSDPLREWYLSTQ